MSPSELQNLKNRYDIIGSSPDLNRALEMAVGVAPTDLTVLVYGESGAGKENIPKIIHRNSRRKNGKYFSVNCGAIPEGTIDSELFGHEKGAFTGAVDMRKGYFEEADGGTLFLDEIAELPLSSQAKLLRVLQEGEFIRVGGNKVLKTDVRVIVATNVNLAFAMQKGKFRADLYYRLAGVTIKMPALRERPDDIPLLFRKFASDFSEKYGMCKINLTPDAVQLLRSYCWPGNVRQLKNVAESVSAMESYALSTDAPRCEVDAATLGRYMPSVGENLPVPAAERDRNVSESDKEAMVRMILQLRDEVGRLSRRVDALQGNVPEGPVLAIPQNMPPKEEEPEEQGVEETEPALTSLRDAEKTMTLKSLKHNGGNRKATAAELGISERTLYRRLRDYGEI